VTLEDTAVDPIRREREIAEADACRVGQRVDQRRRDGDDGAFPMPFADVPRTEILFVNTHDAVGPLGAKAGMRSFQIHADLP
jgi:hypothetical protein